MRRLQAFTLIEVLCVVAIIALLIAVLLPALHRAREQARQALCLSNLHTIGSQLNMYQSAHRGWLPVGPVDKMSYVDKYVNPPGIYDEPKPNTEPLPWSNCHWGGSRAKYIHFLNAKDRDVPEARPRPLTKFMDPFSGLDQRQKVFECPSDDGTPYWEPLGTSAPYYEVCGNSYYVNIWSAGGPWMLNNPYPSISTKRARNTASIVVAEEAPMFEAFYHRRQDYGWHGSFSRHNILFLDFHAENKQVDTRQYYGSGWTIVQYWDIMDYYR